MDEVPDYGQCLGDEEGIAWIFGDLLQQDFKAAGGGARVGLSTAPYRPDAFADEVEGGALGEVLEFGDDDALQM